MIDKTEVKKIAKLARLQLSDAEIEKQQKDLSGILDYMKELDKIDTEGIEPLFQVSDAENVRRADEVLDSALQDQILQASLGGEKDSHFVTKITKKN